MSKAAQLKMKASEFEQRKQYDRALATYVQAIEAATTGGEEVDIPLYNRVGDLHLRLGDLDQAIAYYETAIDLYTEGGFFNNAIALCNKVLRHAPSRAGIYYQLGKISAKKGFTSDAKQNFLEYADRMQKGGDTDEAFRALIEFADLCPSQDDVRLMLADQFARAGRNEEALEQLYIVYNMMVAEDRTTEAAATLERMRVLDPALELADEPRGEQGPRRERRDGLVFIDVTDKTPPAGVSTRMAGFEPTTISSDFEGEIPPLPIEESSAGEPEPPPAEAGQELEPAALEANAEAPAPSEAVSLPEAAPSSEVHLSEPDSDPLQAHRVDETPLAGVVSLREDDDQLLPPAPSSTLPKAAAAPLQEAAPDSDFVDLQAWLQETEPPKNPRMTAQGEEEVPGTIQTDFTQMLEKFKRGVAQHVDEADAESQYDLGVAYMEMGLWAEAVVQFQKAIRGNSAPDRRVRAYEALGQCFIEQGQYDIAIASLQGALQEPWSGEDKLVGILYLLGVASEALGLWDDATIYYQRVFGIDIYFRDVNERLRHARQAAQAAKAS